VDKLQKGTLNEYMPELPELRRLLKITRTDGQMKKLGMKYLMLVIL
jgi:hypothetical protein